MDKVAVDKMVSGFLVYKFRKARAWADNHTTEGHLIHCPTTYVSEAEAGWVCGCYSEYTRDDSFDVDATITCECGETTQWCYAGWGDLPAVLKELEEYNNSECPWEDFYYDSEN